MKQSYKNYKIKLMQIIKYLKMNQKFSNRKQNININKLLKKINSLHSKFLK